jgi:hypothetical protein
MPQLTLYLDNETEKKIKAAAKRAGSSVSSWVTEKLRKAIQDDWPEDYFDILGSLSKVRIARPGELNFDDDAPRTKL